MSRPVHDPTVLRAIAHPVRNRILGELSAQGPLRAADLSRELGVPANSASFHLRQLAKYGLVEEAPGEGRDRRDRVWRLVDDGGLDLDLGAMEKQPGGAAAAAVFRTQAGAWAHSLVDAAYAGPHADDVHRSITDGTVRLSKQEAREFTEDLLAVLRAWTDRTRGSDPSRRTYSILSIIQPLPDGAGGRDGA